MDDSININAMELSEALKTRTLNNSACFLSRSDSGATSDAGGHSVTIHGDLA